MARRDGAGIRLITRNGHDGSKRFPAIVAAVNALKLRSCLIDGEAVACDGAGLAVFQMLRRRRDDHSVSLCAFDLLELDGRDLRREPIEVRKASLERLLRGAMPGIVANVWFDAAGEIVYRKAAANKAYAWSSPIEGSDKRRFFAVLHLPPVTSPVEAVRAAIVGEHRAKAD
jgi:bifunctional non-homologous end joining protein LigD